MGYSDHSIGNLACNLAVALGAKVIEKHYTLDKKLEDQIGFQWIQVI